MVSVIGYLGAAIIWDRRSVAGETGDPVRAKFCAPGEMKRGPNSSRLKPLLRAHLQKPSIFETSGLNFVGEL